MRAKRTILKNAQAFHECYQLDCPIMIIACKMRFQSLEDIYKAA